MIRLYIPEPTPAFAPDLRLALDADQSRYLLTVMRKGVGDELLVFNGRDGEWRAKIAETGKKSAVLQLIEQARSQPAAQGPILAVALIKRARLETIVEKAAELGAAQVQLLITRRSNADHTNVERLRLIAREAAEQTERLDVPDILPPVKFDAWLKAGAFDRLFFADEDSTHEGDAGVIRPLLAALQATPPGRAVLLIGPEGGFDDSERQALRAMPSVVPVGLGPRILRADTAAISALTLFQAAAGDWR